MSIEPENRRLLEEFWGIVSSLQLDLEGQSIEGLKQILATGPTTQSRLVLDLLVNFGFANTPFISELLHIARADVQLSYLAVESLLMNIRLVERSIDELLDGLQIGRGRYGALPRLVSRLSVQSQLQLLDGLIERDFHAELRQRFLVNLTVSHERLFHEILQREPLYWTQYFQLLLVDFAGLSYLFDRQIGFSTEFSAEFNRFCISELASYIPRFVSENQFLSRLEKLLTEDYEPAQIFVIEIIRYCPEIQPIFELQLRAFAKSGKKRLVRECKRTIKRIEKHKKGVQFEPRSHYRPKRSRHYYDKGSSDH